MALVMAINWLAAIYSTVIFFQDLRLRSPAGHPTRRLAHAGRSWLQAILFKAVFSCTCQVINSVRQDWLLIGSVLLIVHSESSSIFVSEGYIKHGK